MVALMWFVARGWHARTDRLTLSAMLIVLLMLLLVAVQLVPLPPGMWQALPGRALAADIMGALGAEDRAFPLSLDPAQTWSAALFLIPPVAMFVAGLHLERQQLVYLLYGYAGLALLDALLTMMQVQGIVSLTFFETAHTGQGQGIFANKNHNALFLVSAVPIIAALSHDLVDRTKLPARILAVGAIAVISIAVFGCMSRAGIALLPVAFVVAAWILAPRGLSKRTGLALVAAGIVLCGLMAWLVAESSVVADSVARFDATAEGRYSFWPDVLRAIGVYFPVGSGLGTFVAVFQSQEALAVVDRTYTNHAHSDYLEIALEAGLAGIVLVGLFLAWFVAAVFIRLRGAWGRSAFPFVLAGAMPPLFLLAHSVLDYPLRTSSLAALFALSLAVVVSVRPERPPRTRRAW
ncbi:O-antigen ligase family protein [Sphingosinithalassobacter sp. LHW66-3]|uniref:O-antigen ligase family protein n=1 Tax=Sphingosinithalassobacter sp. LHW66-3 TaxID=3424718 RepID=UPI003D6C6DB1